VSLILFDAMLVAGWLVLAAIAFALGNARWRFTALPRGKLALLCAGLVIVAVVCAQVTIVVMVIWAVQFCTPPNCF